MTSARTRLSTILMSRDWGDGARPLTVPMSETLRNLQIRDASQDATRLLPFLFYDTLMFPTGAGAIANALNHAGLRVPALCFSSGIPTSSRVRARFDGRAIEMLLISSMQCRGTIPKSVCTTENGFDGTRGGSLFLSQPTIDPFLTLSEGVIS